MGTIVSCFSIFDSIVYQVTYLSNFKVTRNIELLEAYSSITESQNYFFVAFDNRNAFIVRQNGPTSQLLVSD